jgi:DNA repair exonuclease SbcCD ATPase subunit
MRILQFTAENFKRIRIVEIVPRSRVTQITGRNGQGKTSVLDALWALFGGKAAVPEKPVRKGADRSRLRAVIGDDDGKPLLIATRTIGQDRSTALTIEAAPGSSRPAGTPQAILDTLIGQMTFDPLAFIHADKKTQTDTLRTLVDLGDVNLEAENAAIEHEYAERTDLNRKSKDLRAQAANFSYSPNLPADRIDEQEILGRIETANAQNKDLNRIAEEKRNLGSALANATTALDNNQRGIADFSARIEQLESELRRWRGNLEAGRAIENKLIADVDQAQQAFDAAPDPQMIDTQPTLEELQRAQLTNREIDRRTRARELEAEYVDADRRAAHLTRSIEDRRERKRIALAAAKMPVAGLSFDEQGVTFAGIPLEQLGEAEQIRVGVALAMASNPKLRAVPIARGESLDDEALEMIEKLAEEHNFQVFMARVDTSGKVGIVLHDGVVEKVNE